MRISVLLIALFGLKINNKRFQLTAIDLHTYGGVYFNIKRREQRFFHFYDIQCVHAVL